MPIMITEKRAFKGISIAKLLPVWGPLDPKRQWKKRERVMFLLFNHWSYIKTRGLKYERSDSFYLFYFISVFGYMIMCFVMETFKGSLLMSENFLTDNL